MTRRSLDPGTQVARYRVVSLLGAGGMGEVYLARDESLNRSVALKILPPDLVKNDERVRRFVQEAKSASSLNHPHIVTIYEIGEAEEIHFIAMELVSGHTLKTLIHQEKTDLKTLVRYLAQAADGLAKAHAAGIVHRDLKPENIMVTSDGFAKVVDFGLAKLTETSAGSTDLTSAPTATARATGAGMVLGTVGYMSPEQVHGKTVDHRSDIFSLGCVLYEAATRQRPFQADSDIETLHKILKERPQPIEEINPEVPGELRRIVRRCLAKAPEQRAQSMKDLALELAELADEYDTLSASSGSGTRVSSGVTGETPPSRRTRMLVAAAFAVGILGLVAASWSVWWRKPSTPTNDSPAPTRITRVLSSPGISQPMLTPDGRQLVYVRSEEQRQVSLWMHQLATDSAVQLLPPRPGGISLLRFSADGNYLFFSVSTGPGVDIFQLPAIGGTPQPRASVVGRTGMSVALSPDGRFFARTTDPPGGRGRGGTSEDSVRSSLIVTDLDSGQARTVATLPLSETFQYGLTWSPDGSQLAAVVSTPGAPAGGRYRIVAFLAADGRATRIGPADWNFLAYPLWLGDGGGLVVRGTGSDGQPGDNRLWLIAYPGGEVTALSDSDHTSYTSAGDGRTLATMQTRTASSLRVAEAGRLTESRELEAGVSADVSLTNPSAAGAKVFVTRSTGVTARSIWAIGVDGTGGRKLTPDSLIASVPLVAPHGNVVVFRGSRTRGDSRAWRMALDGGGLRQLTSDSSSVDVPLAVSPNGDIVLLRRGAAGGTLDRSTVWQVAGAGGEPAVFLKEDGTVFQIAYSPDGQWLLLCVAPGTGGGAILKTIPSAGGPATRTWSVPERGSNQIRDFRWAPSGDAIDFIRLTANADNIWRQPLGGGPARQISAFTGERLQEFAWSPDGRYLYFTRETRSRDVVLITNFRPDRKAP